MNTASDYFTFLFVNAQSITFFSITTFMLLERKSISKLRPIWQSGCNAVERGRKDINFDMH